MRAIARQKAINKTYWTKAQNGSIITTYSGQNMEASRSPSPSDTIFCDGRLSVADISHIPSQTAPIARYRSLHMSLQINGITVLLSA
jgi:hypothetical protein